MIKRSLGVCYYPEHWPEDMWAEDAKRMADLGLTWVRIGEFSWAKLEPQPGFLNWDWMDRAIETLASQNLKVIMGTPTATPPRWMVDKHPDFLFVDKNGTQRTHGSRRHYCPSHEGYREESARITRLMAERYGTHPAIQAWQTDNEYGCHDTTVSYSRSAEQGFQKWLATQYQTIDALNQAWGNVFWSMTYGSFSDIQLPHQTLTEANPSHVLDFARYSSDAVAAFNKLQTDILRQHTDAPLIHNYMGRVLEFDHFKVGRDLDIASWDSYPLGFLEDRSDQPEAFKHKFMRQGDPDFQAFHHDLYRAVGRGRWWIMEQQPGPVNWAPYNPAPLDGMVRLWTWEAFAHGAEAVCYFRWRQAPFGQEQMHAGLLRPDSAAAKGALEAAQVASELESAPNVETSDAPVAIVFDYESVWAWQAQPQGKDFDYFRLIFDVYRGLRRMGLNIEILPPDTSDFGDRKLVVIPGLMSWTEDLINAMATFTGQILIGPRSGSKTTHMTIPDTLPPGIPGFDLCVDRVESLRPDAAIPVQGGGAIHIWREYVETIADVTLKTEDGHAALVTHDTVSYICGWPDDPLMDRILKTLASRLTLKVCDLPEGVRLRQAGKTLFIFNYSDKPQNLPPALQSDTHSTIDAASVLQKTL